MPNWLIDLFKPKPPEDVRLEVPGIRVLFNHRLRIAILYTADSDTREDAFDALEQHLKRRGYVLQVIVASVGMPVPEDN
jgi:hypothetical protein